MTRVRLEPAASRSRVKHSTTEPLRSQILSDMEKCLKPIFFLKLSALTLETKERHLACNQIKIINKNADKMAAKMAVYYKKYL